MVTSEGLPMKVESWGYMLQLFWMRGFGEDIQNFVVYWGVKRTLLGLGIPIFQDFILFYFSQYAINYIL